MKSVSVFGLGKVGMTLTGCLTAAGNQVIGVDVNRANVDAVNRRRVETREPGVAERIAQAPPDRLRATVDPSEAVLASDVSFVIVPTPSNTLGGFSLRYVMKACDDIGAALRKKKTPHVVSIVSTVMPASSQRLIVPRLESASGRRAGDGLGYCYNPAFIALGEVTKGFERPDYVLIGEYDSASGDAVLDIHRGMIPKDTPIARMSMVEAEICKLASNTHETMRVSFANMLFSACSEVPGANVDRITEALSHRMGRRFFKGAAPYGGPCWPRDNEALSAFMDVIGVPAGMPRGVDIFNREHARFINRKVLAATTPGDTVALLGMAYKPGTHVIERSFGVDLAEWLCREGRRVVAWDPLALDDVRQELGDSIAYAASAADALKRSNAVLVLLPLKELASLDWSAAANTPVLDCWRCLPKDAVASLRRYVPLGAGPAAMKEQWDLRYGDKLDLLTN